MSDVKGWAFQISVEMYETIETRSLIEDHGKQTFQERYGFDPQRQHWVFEDAHTLTDSETEEEFDMPARWVLMTEGIEP